MLVLALVLNLVGFPWSPGFPLYSTSLLLAFVVGFVIFADSVLLEDASGRNRRLNALA